jgi:hypothetical protein
MDLAYKAGFGDHMDGQTILFIHHILKKGNLPVIELSTCLKFLMLYDNWKYRMLDPKLTITTAFTSTFREKETIWNPN